ncbi:protein kinase domain-containing protein [Planctomonas deserti]|uniref:protein kinase domain-containing protein n=1 Tax=Planctomonas deserti TaxID=2144185 RepID=UPI000D3457EF|nr:protein kinase [Planctomonas deserti]
MRGSRRRRRAEHEHGRDDHSAAETLTELATRPLPGPPHDPFRLGGEDDARTIGGYRVLRLLGRGSRADVYLGRLPTWPEPAARRSEADEGLAQGADERRHTYGLPVEVALKVFRSEASAESIDREFATLSAAPSRHVVRLLDVARVADGPVCLVLARCDGGSLPALLERRRSITAGEAVTVLAPILEALACMHRAGFTHGALRLPSVLFDGSGAPVVVGWGHGVSLRDDRGRPPGLERLAATPAVAEDLRRFAAVADAVLAQVEGGSRLAATVRELTARPDSDTEGRLSDALFDFAEPLPVQFVPPDRSGSGVGPSSRVSRPPSRPGSGSQATGRHRRTPGAPTEGAAPAVLERIRVAVRSVRRRVWLAAGLAVMAAVLAATLSLLSGGPPAVPSGAPAPGGTAAAGPLPAEPPRRSTPGPMSPTTPPSQEEMDTAALESAIAGEDPVVAASALLRLRAECLRVRSAACLRGVDQPGSVALAADLAELERLDRPGAGAETDLQTSTDAAEPADAPVLVERLGGTAIVSVPASSLGDSTPDTPPASLLLIRSEAGWRIRDVL